MSAPGSNITIVDRVVERLKKQPIGDLIQEEDLHDIIKQAIPKTFFEPVTTRDGYGRESVSGPPKIVAIMRELLEASARQAVEDWIKANPEIMAETWKKVFDTGLVAYVQKFQDDQVRAQIYKTLQPMYDQANQERQRQGMPPLYPTY